ncbi:MAG: RHS repeat protein, partial [Propionibacteriaceae bacterium]|nr:RHS repeat protein [Propionibacteriaceae bacterium]
MTNTAGDGSLLESVSYTYDADNRLLEETSTVSGTTTYAHDAGGLLVGSISPTGTLQYEYNADRRLRAVFAGGRLMMAASYDGHGERVFQLSAVPMSLTVSAGGSVFDWFSEEFPSTAGGVFWYGFIQALTQQVAGSNPALLLEMQPGIRKVLTTVEHQLPSDLALDERDLGSLDATGIDPADLGEWVSGVYSTLIPEGMETVGEGWGYELTHYVNDINTAHTRVLSTYSAAGVDVANNTYGLDRLSSTGGTVSWLLHDGRGSVGQQITGGGLSFAASYDPYGGAA